MGLLKDFHEDVDGYVFSVKLKHFIDPREWLRLHKWRKQRADRGWSDRDTWGAGDHIAKMTTEILQHLNDSKYTDWPMWFELNVKESGKGAYSNLQQVIDDINGYLAFEDTTWADDLTSVQKEKGKFDHYWVYPNGKIATDADITNRIHKWHKEYNNKYKKAQKAMMFFGRHFSGFWD